VGASRVRKAVDLYHFGLLRQSDWLPVGNNTASEHTHRSADSMSDSDDRDSESYSDDDRSDVSEPEVQEDGDTDSDDISEEQNESDDDAFQAMLERVGSMEGDQDEWGTLFG